MSDGNILQSDVTMPIHEQEEEKIVNEDIAFLMFLETEEEAKKKQDITSHALNVRENNYENDRDTVKRIHREDEEVIVKQRECEKVKVKPTINPNGNHYNKSSSSCNNVVVEVFKEVKQQNNTTAALPLSSDVLKDNSSVEEQNEYDYPAPADWVSYTDDAKKCMFYWWTKYSSNDRFEKKFQAA